MALLCGELSIFQGLRPFLGLTYQWIWDKRVPLPSVATCALFSFFSLPRSCNSCLIACKKVRLGR